MSLDLGTRHRSALAAGGAEEMGPEAQDPLTILVVEDDPAVRAFVGKVLQTQEYDVLPAGDGIEALEVAAGHCGPIHLLLTDLALPRLDGRELARELHLRRPELRAVYMSGYYAAGFQMDEWFLPKPITAGALLRKVCLALQRKTPHEQRISRNRTHVAAG